MSIVNDISLKNFITYTNSVYDIREKINDLKRENSKTDTKASTVAKTLFVSFLCGYKSIHALNVFLATLGFVRQKDDAEEKKNKILGLFGK